MLRLKIRRSFWLVFAPVAVLALFTSPALANNPIVTQPTDFWFDYLEPTQFVAQTYMIENYPSDPMLWLYNEEGTLLAQNDDSFGLQSYISLAVPAGKYRLRAGICCGDPNAWRTNGGWNLQYELGFNGAGQTSTSTTEATTTTSTSTTSTTTTSTTTTSTTTTTTTTTTIPITTTTVRPITTTTSEPIVYASTTTSVVPSTTSTTTSTTTLAPVLITTTTTSQPEVITSTTIVPDAVSPLVAELLSNIDELPQSEIASIVAQSVEDGITPDDALALATSVEVLNAVTQETATEIFQSLDVTELSDAQAEQLVEAVQNAPTEVREAFENEVDLFNGKTDTYVPIGSSVPVRTRRAVIAVTGLLAIASVPAPSKQNIR